VADIEREKKIILDYENMRELATEMWIVLDGVAPISINTAYSGAGHRFLTKEGKHFEDAMKTATAHAISALPVKWQDVVDCVYKNKGSIDLRIWLYFDDLWNPAWKPGEMTKGGKKRGPVLQSPFKKKDATNYVKLVEDSIVKGSGIDDSCFTDVSVSKREDLTNPRVVANYRVYI
jgi:hypothetical protein